MAIKFSNIDVKPDKEQKAGPTKRKETTKTAIAKRVKKNADISATMSGERPKVTLPKFSWDKENDKI
jgi:hypothetical protein